MINAINAINGSTDQLEKINYVVTRSTTSPMHQTQINHRRRTKARSTTELLVYLVYVMHHQCDERTMMNAQDHENAM